MICIVWVILKMVFILISGNDEGFWGEVIFMIDWCEENYVVILYLVEFCKWNFVFILCSC